WARRGPGGRAVTTTMTAPTVRRAIGRRVPMPTEVTDLTLAELGPPLFAIVAYGNPAPQGSKEFKGMRASKKDPTKKVAILAESSDKRLKAWRAAVRDAALAALPHKAMWEPIEGPLVADFVLSLHRPQNRPK